MAIMNTNKVFYHLNNLKRATMKKLTNTLSGVKNMFYQQHNSAQVSSTGCVELTDAALRTCGSTGKQQETNHFMRWNPPN